MKKNIQYKNQKTPYCKENDNKYYLEKIGRGLKFFQYLDNLEELGNYNSYYSCFIEVNELIKYKENMSDLASMIYVCRGLINMHLANITHRNSVNKNIKNANKDFTMAIEKNPKNVCAYYYRSLIQLEEKDRVCDLDKVIQFSKDKDEIYKKAEEAKNKKEEKNLNLNQSSKYEIKDNYFNPKGEDDSDNEIEEISDDYNQTRETTIKIKTKKAVRIIGDEINNLVGYIYSKADDLKNICSPKSKVSNYNIKEIKINEKEEKVIKNLLTIDIEKESVIIKKSIKKFLFNKETSKKNGKLFQWRKKMNNEEKPRASKILNFN